MNDTEEEDLELYGEPVPDNTDPSDTAAVTVKECQLSEKEKVEETHAHHTELYFPSSAKTETKGDSANSIPNSTLTSELKIEQTPKLPEEKVAVTASTQSGDATLPMKEHDGLQTVDGSGGQDEDVQKRDATGQKQPQLSEDVRHSEGGVKSGDKNTDSEEDSEEDDDVDNDDEDSEDDDFDVILNYDEADNQAKPPSAPFGSIGKVRLSSNKWQRPGYVPPERVIGVPTQGAARTGGVLSMLPTPTMQIGGSQKSVYDLEIGKLTEKPWLDRNADLSDYFNYGFNEDTWKLYCERQKQMRLEASMLAKIKTVDGNKNQATPGNRAAAPGSPKVIQGQSGTRIQAGGTAANRGTQNKPQQQGNQPLPPPPPGMMPPPLGFEGPPGGMLPIPPGMEKVPKMPGMPPNMPFPFPPGAPNPKGGNFQPPFPPFLPLPSGQRNGEGNNNAMFPPMMPPGMPGLPPGMPMPPSGMPAGVSRGGSNTRGFPGELQTPQKLQQPQNKNGKASGSGHGTPDPSHREEQKRPGTQGHQGSRFSNAQGNQSRPPQPNRPPHPDGDRRQRWEENRGPEDRRQSYDRDRGRSGHDDRGYGDRGSRGDRGDRGGERGDRGDRGYERRRWGDREDGYDRRRGGGHDSQRYSDSRRDYDRDRGRDYRKRSSSGRDYDDDRKRSRR